MRTLSLKHCTAIQKYFLPFYSYSISFFLLKLVFNFLNLKLRHKHQPGPEQGQEHQDVTRQQGIFSSIRILWDHHLCSPSLTETLLRCPWLYLPKKQKLGHQLDSTKLGSRIFRFLP